MGCDNPHFAITRLAKTRAAVLKTLPSRGAHTTAWYKWTSQAAGSGARGWSGGSEATRAKGDIVFHAASTHSDVTPPSRDQAGGLSCLDPQGLLVQAKPAWFSGAARRKKVAVEAGSHASGRHSAPWFFGLYMKDLMAATMCAAEERYDDLDAG